MTQRVKEGEAVDHEVGDARLVIAVLGRQEDAVLGHPERLVPLLVASHPTAHEPDLVLDQFQIVMVLNFPQHATGHVLKARRDAHTPVAQFLAQHVGMHGPDVHGHGLAIFVAIALPDAVEVREPQRRHLADRADGHLGRGIARLDGVVGIVVGAGVVGGSGVVLPGDVRLVADDPRAAGIVGRHGGQVGRRLVELPVQHLDQRHELHAQTPVLRRVHAQGGGVRKRAIPFGGLHRP